MDDAGANRIGDIREYDRDGAGCLLHRRDRNAAYGHDHVRRECNQFGRVLTNAVGFATGKAIIDLQVSADCPAQLLETLREHRTPDLCLRVARNKRHQHADAPHPVGLLGPRRKRPRSRRATEKRDEVAPPHDQPRVREKAS